MKRDLNMIMEILDEVSKSRGDEFSIPVLINGRLTATMGRVIGTLDRGTGICTPDRLEISKKLLEHGTYEDIRKVVLHEWCHYYLMKTTKKNHGHDSVFVALAKEIDCSAGTATVIEGFKDMKDKYETFCTCCGKRTGSYSRAGKVVKESYAYSSGCCKAPIKVVQNW